MKKPSPWPPLAAALLLSSSGLEPLLVNFSLLLQPGNWEHRMTRQAAWSCLCAISAVLYIQSRWLQLGRTQLPLFDLLLLLLRGISEPPPLTASRPQGLKPWPPSSALPQAPSPVGQAAKCDDDLLRWSYLRLCLLFFVLLLVSNLLKQWTYAGTWKASRMAASRICAFVSSTCCSRSLENKQNATIDAAASQLDFRAPYTDGTSFSMIASRRVFSCANDAARADRSFNCMHMQTPMAPANSAPPPLSLSPCCGYDTRRCHLGF